MPGHVVGAVDRGVSKAEKTSTTIELTLDGREQTRRQMSTMLGSDKHY